ncbi:MAG: hypothetical protein AAGH92_00075 [Planctomycetota bacterium]
MNQVFNNTEYPAFLLAVLTVMAALHGMVSAVSARAEGLMIPENLPADTPAFVMPPQAASPTLHLVPLDPPIMDRGGVYGGWGQGAIGPDGRFYFAIGNHLTSPDADAWLFAYDPNTQTLTPRMSTRQTAGWSKPKNGDRDAELGDGKLHTAIDIAPDGTTYVLSFCGDYPTRNQWATGYPGGRLFRHNVRTGRSEYLGVPYAQDSWPVQRWDHARGILIGIGERGLYLNPDLGPDERPAGDRWSGEHNQHSYGSLLVYDTQAERVVYAGLPETLTTASPSNKADPLRVERRALLLDPKSGLFFSSGTASPTELMLIDPPKIRENPADGIRRTGLTIDSPVRAGTRRTTAGGELIFVTRAGTLYALHAEDRTLRKIGPAWTPGVWITDLCLDPTGRFVDFVVDSTWSGRAYGVPVVRYELATGRRTVLAFLAPTLFARDGYCVVGAYTAATNPTGDHMFIQVNGHFGDDPDVARYEQPALVELSIPPAP